MAAKADLARKLLSAALPGAGRGPLRRLLAYAKKSFALDRWLKNVRDRRRAPRVAVELVARALLLVAVLRIRSFNALEPKLAEPTWAGLLGLVPRPDGKKLFSVDTLAYSLQRMDVSTVRSMLVGIVRQAERNKVFREGWVGAMRYVAIDGWEPFSSRSRCCEACLTREITIGEGKAKRQVTEYYHRYVVALLLDEKLEVVLDVEPVQSIDVRKEMGDVHAQGHEGELTAAKRLVRRLRTTYGRWLDVLVCDALYACGPFLTIAEQCGFGVIAVLKKTDNEPLKEALAIWGDRAADVIRDTKHEHVELWDCRELRTLETYSGPIRVVRGVVHKLLGDTTHTWCFAVTGKAARLPAAQVLRVGRGRWHIENTGFHQWTKYWPLGHVFTHGPDAIVAMLWFFFVAFNLTQLFVYRQLGGYGRDRGRDVTRTFKRLVDEMRDELARLVEPLAWDTS